MSITLEHQLIRYKERTPGFDVCRIALAVAVFVSHSITSTVGAEGQKEIWLGPLGPPLSAIMPMFFALSGFLVMGSLARMKELRSFVAARGLRIVPALMTEIILSALLVGPLITSLPLADYVSYSLPGVFGDIPYPDVINGSLWTIPPEITCYLYLSLMALFRFRRTAYVIVALALFAANCGYEVLAFLHHAPLHQVPTSRYLFLSFAAGNLLYVLRARVPFRFDLFLACTGLGLAMMATNLLVAPSVICMSYSVVYLGCSCLRLPIDLIVDYSYGIYL